MKKRRLVELAINIGAIAIAIGVVVALQIPKIAAERQEQTPESDQKLVRQEQARLNFLQKLPRSGFGYNNLIADLTFLNFLQYFGDDVAREDHKTGYGLSPEYFEVILKRDPRFIDAYTFASISVSVYAAQPEKAVALYEQGLPHMKPENQPYAYIGWRRKAIDELLFLNKPQAAIKSYLTAADWADRATFGENALPETQYVAERSRQTAAFLQANPDSKPARIAAWSEVLATAVDQKSFEIAVTELNKLGVGVRMTEDGTIQTYSLQSPPASN
jgi:hypothetical protein